MLSLQTSLRVGLRRQVMAPTIALLLLAGGAHAQSQPPVATGPGPVSISTEDLRSDIRRIPESSRARVFSKPESVQQLASGLYARRALALEARALKLEEEPSLKAELQQAMDRVLAEAYMRHLLERTKPSEAELAKLAEARYKATPERFMAPEETQARHILVAKAKENAEQTAAALLKQLQQGANFEELAKSQSDDKGSAARGGDLGFFAKGKMVPQFQAAVDALQKPGDLSPVVETQFGYHVIRLEAKRAPRALGFEEVKPQLMQEALAAVQQERRREASTAVLAKMQMNEQVVEEFAKEFAKQLTTE